MAIKLKSESEGATIKIPQVLVEEVVSLQIAINVS